MKTDRHIEIARQHLKAGNVEAYKNYMRALFNLSMSKRNTALIIAALNQDGIEV